MHDPRSPERPAHAPGEPPAPSGTDPQNPDTTESLRKEVLGGLLYIHSRLNANTSETLEASAFLAALVELLQERGLVSLEDLEARKHAAGQRLAGQFDQKGIGVMLNPDDADKYAFGGAVEIDCANRIHLCRASCCRLPFALSKQDVMEGIVRWDLSEPYMNVRRDGYCGHLERDTCRCTIHSSRPVPCRVFDCRQDSRIWLDFEGRVPNPAVERDDWPHCLETGDHGAQVAGSAPGAARRESPGMDVK